jgi:hypothetical protein
MYWGGECLDGDGGVGPPGMPHVRLRAWHTLAVAGYGVQLYRVVHQEDVAGASPKQTL